MAVHLKSGRAPRLGGYPLAWVMAVQACVPRDLGVGRADRLCGVMFVVEKRTTSRSVSALS